MIHVCVIFTIVCLGAVLLVILEEIYCNYIKRARRKKDMGRCAITPKDYSRYHIFTNSRNILHFCKYAIIVKNFSEVHFVKKKEVTMTVAEVRKALGINTLKIIEETKK